jgi:DNA-binding GntR family transcriptional regulator
MADGVATRLRRMILTGELAPGRRVTQDELAKMLGVSTMPVREALLRLVAEGLISAAANRSFSVVSTTLDDIRDIFWMHSVLAGELTRRACERSTDELVEVLREAREDYLEALAAKDGERMQEANWRFHRAINEAADAPKLLLVLRTTLRFFPDFRDDVPGWPELAGRWHRHVLDAFLRRRPDEARQAAETHVREAGEILVAHARRLGLWSDANSGTAEAAAAAGSAPR